MVGHFTLPNAITHCSAAVSGRGQRPNGERHASPLGPFATVVLHTRTVTIIHHDL